MVEELSKGEKVTANKGNTEYCYIVFNIEIKWRDR